MVWKTLELFIFIMIHDMSFVKISNLNLAVSGSISSSSLTGERGTLAENFSGICKGISALGADQQKIQKYKNNLINALHFLPISGRIIG